MSQEFDQLSLDLNDRVEAIASSENVSYTEALDKLLALATPQKTASTDFDEHSQRQSAAIANYADRHNLTFSEAFDAIAAEARETARSNGSDFSEAFDEALALV